MSALNLHGEWLSLLDISGPFLAEPVLKEALPQGLQGLDPIVRKELRQAYDEWREALDFGEADFPKLHGAWISFVLSRVLGYGAELLQTGAAVADGYRCIVPESSVVLKPDAMLTDGREGGRSFLLVSVYPADVSLDEVVNDDGWAATPIERTFELCRGTGTRLALVTNGERWILVDAPVGGAASTASWYAKLWSQEPLTLQAFADLLGVRRFFGGTDGELTTLLDKSLTLQDEVTDALGEQVRRAVEVLVQSLDRADQDRNRELLKDVSTEELYEAGLTIMMRIVFLLSAEERGLLLLGDSQYESNYAVSTLRGKLRAEPEEVLERRWDAWSRLLALFRAVFAGIDHGVMRMPALGGSLFDPDRFPFLEGRPKGTNWKTDPAVPLPIDNRKVLLLLDAVQLFQGRTLSYLALDVEQIGYVYEGLLERTVVRAKEATLDLVATKSAKSPWITVSELEDAAADGSEAVVELLKERTGSSASRIRNDLTKTANEAESDKLLAACQGDVGLRDRVEPYFQLLRTDSWGYPLVYPKGTFMVASGSDRRETGTHYTPKSFTEAIVKTTLEPLVYTGPAAGLPREEWSLEPVDQLLDLKVCDPTMGSGAFLVQVCRYLGERVLEAWAEAERSGRIVSSIGEVKESQDCLERLTQNPYDRSLLARRLIAERCLYGVDMNPLAVELAKLSIWLVTLAKGRPFGFLDHNLRCGDSLLGIADLDQLRFLDMTPRAGSERKLFASSIDRALTTAIDLRTQIRGHVIQDIRDVEFMAVLNEQADSALNVLDTIADAFIGEVFAANGLSADVTSISIEAGAALDGDRLAIAKLRARAEETLVSDLPAKKLRRRPLHWPLYFPEVFATGGFDAMVGNPPFLGGKRISMRHGPLLFAFLKAGVGHSIGTTDLCVFFLLRTFRLIHEKGFLGLILSDIVRQGDSRATGLEQILSQNGTIYYAISSAEWPGAASVKVANVNISKASWSGDLYLDGTRASSISSFLRDEPVTSTHPEKLKENKSLSFTGHYLMGQGFVLTNHEAARLVSQDGRNSEVIYEYIRGDDVNNSPCLYGELKAINFGSRSLDECRDRYPIALSWVEQRVRPEREAGGGPEAKKWWLYARARPALEAAIASFDRVLVQPFTAKYVMPSLVPARAVFAHPLVVFSKNSPDFFAALQSNIHSVWAWEYCSTSLDLMRYTADSIVATFPFPNAAHSQLVRAGTQFLEERDEVRAKLGLSNNDIMNAVHDKTNQSSDFVKLRGSLVQIDETLCAAYGWDDLRLDHDYWGIKVGERFTVSDSARRELLRRLVSLNKSRFAAETATAGLSSPKRVRKSKASNSDEDMFAEELKKVLSLS